MPDINKHVLHLWDQVVILRPDPEHQCYRGSAGQIVRLVPSDSGVDAEVVFDDLRLVAHLFAPHELMVIDEG